MNALTPRRKPPKRPRAGEQLCDCGCGVPEYFNKLKMLDIEIARDEELRETKIMRRHFVRPECFEDFVRELQAKQLLEGFVASYIRVGAPWYRKIWKMRRIVKLQFVINVRLRGVEATKRMSLRSGILFVAPQWLGYYLDRYWRWSNENELTWRFRLSPAQSKTLARTWTSIIGIIAPRSRGCLPSPLLEQIATSCAESRLSVVPHPECCRTAGPQK